jgi:Na+-transporting NADH:ubiquinone oxidoreductase subunit C
VHKNSYVFIFAASVTVICSLLLASAATLLKDRQQENIKLDMQKNILVSAGYVTEDKEFTRAEILNLYDKNIASMVINNSGESVEGKTVEQLDRKKDTNLLPLYYSQEGDEIKSYILPISGKGLWSTIYGYLALERDVNTVMGITFYQHGETPGLGGEIVQNWFRSNFVGKKIYSPEGELVSITVIKGKVEGTVAESEQYHYVDGISGSTLTGNGLNNFLMTDLKKYEPFFNKIRSKAEME